MSDESTAITRPAPIWIQLTPEQAKQLEAHFAVVQSEADRGRLGMLVAQVWESRIECGHAPAMCVGFIPVDMAKLLEHTAK